MGSCFRVRVESVNLEEVLAANSLKVYGAVLNGQSMYETKMESNGFLIIGNESKGISSGLSKYITDPIKIPKFGHAESLNAAVAAGIILAHWKA
jgi:TrmH family RNA methyltransferase